MISYIILLALLLFFLYDKSKCIIICAIVYPTLCLFTIGKIPVIMIFVFLVYIYWILDDSKYIKKKFPFLLPFSISVLSYVISYFWGKTFGHHNSLISNVIYYVFIYVLWIYWPSKVNKYKRFLYVSFLIYLTIVSVFGIYESLTGKNQFIHYLYTNGMLERETSSQIRYGFHRAQSLTLWFETYAATCGMGIAFIWASVLRKFIKPNIYIFILTLLLIISVVTSGSRSMMFMTMIMILGIIPKVASHAKVLFVIVPLLIMLYYAQEKLFDQVVNSFANQEQFHGSSIDMRKDQLKSTIKFWEKEPIIGHGLGYIGEATKKDRNLWGGESIIFFALIDRGLIGLLSLLYLYAAMGIFFLRKQRLDIFMMIFGFLCGKIITMVPAMVEAYILIYAIPLYLLSTSSIHSQNKKRLISNNSIKAKLS